MEQGCRNARNGAKQSGGVAGNEGWRNWRGIQDDLEVVVEEMVCKAPAGKKMSAQRGLGQQSQV
jgi:hypothetical protein